jgi:pimeloyl-ACP methyl ester carboxylesterase
MGRASFGAGLFLSSLLWTIVPGLGLSQANAGEQSGIVFVADGGAGVHGPSGPLARLAESGCVPLCVEPVDWSSKGRVFRDLHGHAHRCEQGQRLACKILGYLKEHPGCRIYLVGHSAGAAVVLSAAEGLPCDCVERIILLAPAVCSETDLRPALRCSRQGIDSFYSRKDRLAMMLTVVGTSDGFFKSVAGWSGFSSAAEAGCDAALYQKLRQHTWEWSHCSLGHLGGHWGFTREAFLRTCVMPLLQPEVCGGCAVKVIPSAAHTPPAASPPRTPNP